MQHLQLNEWLVFTPSKSASLIALEEALTRLESIDPRKAQVVELRYFSGMRVEETADLLHVSGSTVTRDWSSAKLWLKREIMRGKSAA
jgi:RNA polymerase sigma factor (sigma-70 family)